MDTESSKQFALAINVLASGFRVELSAPLIEAYRLGLDGLPMADIKRAVSAALQKCRFMPTPADLRELAGEMTPKTRAVLAWDAFERAVRIHGGYASITFDDPAINATIRNLGGWQRLCDMPVKEFDTWVRKDFERVYAELCQVPLSPEAASPLIGIHEQTNRFLGHKVEPKTVMIETGLAPVRIGASPAGQPAAIPDLSNVLREVPRANEPT